MFSSDETTCFAPADVLVFKSDIQTRVEAMALCTALNSIPGVERCTVDLEDCDKVVRVQGDCLESSCLRRIVQDWGVHIEELD